MGDTKAPFFLVECFDHSTWDSLVASVQEAYSHSGTKLSSVFILSDHNKGIDLFGATDPEYRKNFGSTRLVIDVIERSFEKGNSIFDLCGMNSPKRGTYKASFNARVVSYFEVKLVPKIASVTF